METFFYFTNRLTIFYVLEVTIRDGNIIKMKKIGKRKYLKF